jgi:hypothetical protein
MDTEIAIDFADLFVRYLFDCLRNACEEFVSEFHCGNADNKD